MSPAYKSLVKQYYVKKRNENALPSRLMYPTTAKLKEQCLVEFAKGFSPNDRKVLIDFFGESEDDDAILKKIKRSRPDDFKALCNYLNKDLKKPSDKNVELVAWLTSFESRPYDYLKNYDLEVLETAVVTPEVFPDVEEKGKKQEKVEENNTPKVEVVDGPPHVSEPIIDDNIKPVGDVEIKTPLVVPPLNSVQKRNKRNAIIALVVVILVVASTYIFMGKGKKGLMGSTLSKEGDGCMYWAGDHYQQVPCNQKMGETWVIALDTEMLNSFKKITQPDTITSNCIGRVWYIKLNNKLEFYTASGNYPLDLTLRLKPITDYIIKKYIDTAR